LQVLAGRNIKDISKTRKPNSEGYYNIYIDGHVYWLHRLAFLYVEGGFPEEDVDHIDGNPGNNAFSNLRKCNRSENCSNRRLSPTNKTTGIKGLSIIKQKYYEAKIVKNKIIYHRYFDLTQTNEAIEWLKETRAMLHGEFARDL
jgi:hypothetical protein